MCNEDHDTEGCRDNDDFFDKAFAEPEYGPGWRGEPGSAAYEGSSRLQQRRILPMSAKARELTRQTYVTGYEVRGDYLSSALAEAALLVKKHEELCHLVRINVEWEADTEEYLVFITVLA